MRKLKMATEYTLAAAKAAFLGILMSCLAMAPVAAPAALAVVAGSGCNAAQVQADIRTVLNDLPTAINIAEAIATIISGAGVSNTNTVTEITNWGGQIAEDLKLSQSLLTQYQSGLASAPAGIISEFDTAIATINSNLTAILNATHVYDLTTQRAVSVWITGIDGVLLGLESLVPASVVNKFPASAKALSARGRTLGAIKATVPSPRHLAKSYNAGVEKNFPAATVSVPRLHLLGIPV